MKQSIMAVMACAAAFIAIAATGCSGGGNSSADAPKAQTASTSSSTATTGRLQLRFAWPDASPTRSIPKETQAIDVQVIDSVGAIIANQSVAKGSNTADFSGLPTGGLTVRAFARGTDCTLASGEKQVSLAPTTTNTVSLTMDELPCNVDDDRYVLGGSLAPDPNDPSLLRISLNAIINRSDGKPVTGLSADNFVVLEDDIRRQPITVKQASDVRGAKVDIAFVIDTTGSMDGTIDGVRDSVSTFAQKLSTSGQDVRFAGVSFGDEVRGSIGFTDVSAFQNWVSSLNAFGGDDVPENPCDAVLASLGFSWRPDAQHLIVVITDAPAHEADTITSSTLNSVAKSAVGGYVIHTVSEAPTRGQKIGRDNNGKQMTSRGRSTDRDVSLLASATGGTSLALPSSGYVDLTSLGIDKTILAGYVVGFSSAKRTPPIEHTVRLVVKQDGVPVADQLFPSRY